KKDGSEELINILFKELEDGTYETFLVKYNISVEGFKSLTKEGYIQTPEFHKIAYSYSDNVSTTIIFCDPILQDVSYPANQGEVVGVHEQDETMTVIIGYDCTFYSSSIDVGGGGNNPPAPSNSNGGTDGTYYSGPPTVITTPLPEFETDLTPC